MSTKIYPRVMLKTISLVTNKEKKQVIKISFPFSVTDLDKVRSIVGRKYHAEAKCWSCPLSIDNIQTLIGFGFSIDMKLKEYMQEKQEMIQKTKLIEMEQIELNIPGLQGELRPFQKAGVLRADALDGNMLNADDQGLGKEQPLTAKILTPSGWTNMGKIKKGDYVIGLNGTPVLVKQIYPQGLKKVYKVSFSDGSSTECGVDHLWTIQNKTDRAKKRWQTLPLSQIKKTELKKKDTYNWNIPVVAPIQYQQENKLSLHPYILGFLLGNGNFCNDSVRISFPDKETENNIKLFLPKTVKLVQHEECYWGITAKSGLRRRNSNPIMKMLSDLGLRGKKTLNKFIPKEYLFSSIQNRLFLLQGLLDSDGCATKGGRAEFGNTSPKLINGVIELVRSLGGIAIKNPIPDVRGTLDYYAVYISLAGNMNPFLLTRKRNRFKPEIKRSRKLKRSIVGIEYIGKKECQCISINTKDGLYVTDEFIITHNTIETIAYLQWRREKLPVLLVVPAVVKINWSREVTKWMSPIPKVQILSGETPFKISGEIVIINYDILQYWEKEIGKFPFKMIVGDEIQNIKNSSTKRTKAFKRIKKKIPTFMALSGTPIENHPSELYNAISMIDPTLFPIAWDFYWEFCDPKNNGYGWTHNGATNIPKLHRMLTESIMLRRLKKDVLPELPEKIISFVPIELTNQKEYDFAERDFINWVHAYKGKEAALRAENAEAIQKIEGLKQIAVKGKMKGAIDWVKDFLESDRKLVIATTHTFVIDELVKAFPGISLRLDGTVTGTKRQEAVDAFQTDPVFKLFIVNMKAGGIGITLTAAWDLIILELGWNPKIIDQMMDRVHRIGQVHGVNIYYLLALATIEEKIAELLDKKRKVIDGVIDGIETDQDSLLGELMKSYTELDAVTKTAKEIKKEMEDSGKFTFHKKYDWE